MKRILLALSLFCMTGCGAREEIVISTLDIRQHQWDSLEVSVAFARRTVLSGDSPISADSIYLVAYNTAYDTLYVGADTLFYIADADLGNRERVLLEVCGQVKLVQVCEQTSVESSPKRIRVEPDISYPWNDRVYQGSYRLPFVVERQSYGNNEESWEPISRTQPIPGFIQAYVSGREEESIHLPFTKKQDGFNLTHHPNYKDFKYYLDSALLDHNQANVQFDVFVNITGFTGLVGSVSKEIALKTEEEHQVEVARLSRLAAEQLVERLNPFLDERRNIVYIDSWNYNRFRQMYTIDMEVEWAGNLFTRNEYRVQGKLDVYDNDLRATFRLTDANRRAERLWERASDSNVLTLKPLDSFDKNDPASLWSSDASVFYFNEGSLLIEAENYHSTISRNDLSWRIEQNPVGFSGNGAMVVLPDRDVRVRSQFNRESPSLEYQIMFTEPGTYYVWVRAWARDNNSNSVSLGFNGREISTLREIEVDDSRRWTWTRELMSERGVARVDVRTPGMHTLNVWMREDGFYLDRILLTRDRFLRPANAESQTMNTFPDETAASEGVGE